MNLRELEYVIAIDHHLNFSKAAEACNVSQPALSNQIKKLELELGTPLFARSNSEVRVTPLGERVIESAKRIVLESRKIRDMATEYRDPAALPLRIGLDPTLAPYLLHYLRSAIAAQVPEMKVNIVEGEIASLADGVATRDIDIALIPRDSYQGALDFTPLFYEKLFLVVTRDHMLATQDSISLYDIPFDQLIRLSSPLGFTSEARIHPSQDYQRSNKHHEVETSSFETLCQHIRHIGGCSIVPALAAEQVQAQRADLALVPIAEDEERRCVGVISRVGCPRKSVLAAIVGHIHTNPPPGACLLSEPANDGFESRDQVSQLALKRPQENHSFVG